MKGIRTSLAALLLGGWVVGTHAVEKTASPAPVSAGLAEILKMNDSGVAQSVIKEFIRNSGTIYEPRADEIIYLHDHGISGEVITALIQRGAELKKSLPAQPAMPIVTQPQASAREIPIVQQAAPAPPVVVTAPSYTYVQPEPVYVYPYPSFSFGWSYPWYYRSSYAYPPLYTHARYYGGYGNHWGGGYGYRGHAGFSAGIHGGGHYGGFHAGGFSGGFRGGAHGGGHR